MDLFLSNQLGRYVAFLVIFTSCGVRIYGAEANSEPPFNQSPPPSSVIFPSEHSRTPCQRVPRCRRSPMTRYAMVIGDCEAFARGTKVQRNVSLLCEGLMKEPPANVWFDRLGWCVLIAQATSSCTSTWVLMGTKHLQDAQTRLSTLTLARVLYLNLRSLSFK